MSLILSERYPGRANKPTAGRPRGSVKNRTAPNSADGTYLEEDMANDERAFQDAILEAAGVTPNGKVDTGEDSQVYKALMATISGMISTANEPMFAFATGTADALAAAFPRSVSLIDGFQITVRAAYANTSTIPSLNAGSTGARTICKGANQPLLVGDIAGAGHTLQLSFDTRFNKWVLLNPAYGISQPETIPVGTMAYFGRTGTISGWLPMNGGEYSRAQYAQLVSQCPDIILAGGNSSTFRLPDTRGLFLRVLDQGRGVDVGRNIATRQEDAIRNITGYLGQFNQYANDQSGVSGAFYVSGGFNGQGNKSGHSDYHRQIKFDASRVVDVANEVRPKNIAFPVYIKY